MPLNLIQVFTTTLIILGTFGNIIIFESLLDSIGIVDKRSRRNILKKAYLIAYLLWIFIFLFGTSVLELFGITILDFKVAGGILLFIIALDILKDISPKVSMIEGKTKVSESIASTPMAVPLITGPGTITTTLLFTSIEKSFILFIVMSLAFFSSFIVVYFGEELIRKIGKTEIILINRLMGLILLSIAVEFIMDGIKQFFLGI